MGSACTVKVGLVCLDFLFLNYSLLNLSVIERFKFSIPPSNSCFCLTYLKAMLFKDVQVQNCYNFGVNVRC